MAVIVQGDQYLLPVKIITNNSTVTPDDVDDIRIQLDNNLKSYSDGEITFNDTTNEWLYPLTEEMTQQFNNVLVPIQVGIKVGTEIMYSATIDINVGQSIIKKEWE